MRDDNCLKVEVEAEDEVELVIMNEVKILATITLTIITRECKRSWKRPLKLEV